MVKNKSSYTVTDAGSKDRAIRIITIKIVFHNEELLNVSQSEVTEDSGESIV